MGKKSHKLIKINNSKSPCRKIADSTIKIKTVVKEVLRRDILQQVAVMVTAEWLATDCPE